MRKISIIALFMLLLPVVMKAQTAPAYWQDILAFKKTDSTQRPAKNPILFVGSSSFTKWTDVNSYFPGYPIINRGFGGSTLVDVIRYAYDVIIPYQPKQVVIYCGENDIASYVPAAEVVTRFKTLYGIVRTNLPNAEIDFVSMKLSPSRKQFYGAVKTANTAISVFLKGEKHTAFIDIVPGMLDAAGKPKEELFLPDMLHMKAPGYVIWQKAIQPYLLK